MQEEEDDKLPITIDSLAFIFCSVSGTKVTYNLKVGLGISNHPGMI